MKTKPETIAELRRLHEAATPGPWRAGGSDSDCFFAIWEEDGSFIVAMRNALPGLLDDLERMREVLEETHALLGICSDIVICGDCGPDYGCDEVPNTKQILEDQYKQLSATLKELEADK